METHSSILALKIPLIKEPGGLQSWGCRELDTTEQLSRGIARKWSMRTFIIRRAPH